MSNDLPSIIAHIWESKVLPKLLADPDELQVRLARRRAGMMRRPPRAWCVALRAADQRINPMTAACVPEDVAHSPTFVKNQDYSPEQHEVTITAKLVRELVRPIKLEGRLEMHDLCERLGFSHTSIKGMAKRGVFRVHKIPGLGGKRGRPVPLYYTEKLLDPCCGRGREMPDPIWGTTWRYLADHVPDDLEQTLVRVPHFVPTTSRSCFMGWHWVCPGCRRRVRLVCYPLGKVHGVELFLNERDARRAEEERERAQEDPAVREYAQNRRNEVDEVAEPLKGFACASCHHVMTDTGGSRDAWNKIVSHLSGGLVYGHEVPKPEGYELKRRRAYRPLLRREPSKQREMILRDILAGLSYRQITRKQLIAQRTVSMQAREIYRQHGVNGPRQLRALFAKHAARREYALGGCRG